MKTRRIVVALDAATRPGAAVETAAKLAARLRAELAALFVEDVDLLHLAGFPFAREIGFPSAIRRELDVAAMERSWRRLAEDARRDIAAIAGRGALRWTFQVSRGSLAAQLFAAAAEADLVIADLAGLERRAQRIAALGNDPIEASLLPALREVAQSPGGIYVVLLGEDISPAGPAEPAERDSVLAARARSEQELSELLRELRGGSPARPRRTTGP